MSLPLLGAGLGVVAAGVPLAEMPAGAVVRARYSANHSAVTEVSGRVTGATNLAGVAGPLVPADSAAGPLVVTDALGRKMWLFDQAAALSERTMAMSSRSALIVVGKRLGRSNSTATYASLGYVGGTPINTGGRGIMTTVAGASESHVYHLANRPPNSRALMQAGFETHVVAVSGDASSSEFRYNQLATTAAAPSNYSGTGLEIGRYAYNSSSYGSFYAYEIVLLEAMTASGLTAAVAALMAAYGITNTTDQLLLEGDSITAGWATAVPLGQMQAERLGELGSAAQAPAGWRVLSAAVSGNAVADLVSRRDTANSAASLPLPGGRNVLVVQIGYNDTTPANVVPGIAALLNTASTGYLQRGWEVVVHQNIACANSANFTNKILVYRAGLADLAFLTACDANAGGTYAGKVTVNPLYLWQVGGVNVFNDRTDVNSVLYDADGLHPNGPGSYEIAKAIRALLP